MKNLKKILSVLALIVLVGSDFLTSISYALEDGLEDSVVVQTESEEETENVENEEGKIDEEDSEDAYKGESIEEENEAGETVESTTGDIVEEGTGKVSEIGSGEIGELTEETVEGATGVIVEELTGEIVESTGTGEETVIEEIRYNEEPIIGEKTYNDVTVRVEALTGIFPEGTELAIEPIKWWNLSSLKDKLVEEKEEIKEDTTIVAFDIAFKYEGEEVQPKDGEKVKVIFDYSRNEDLVKADKNKNQEVKVYHLEDKDEEGNKVALGEEKVVDVTNKEESTESGIAVADADSFSIYVVTYGNEDPEFSATLIGDDSARNDFHYKTITISDGTHTYTLMDRNLGARVAWDGTNFAVDNSGNYNTVSDYYGYYYQWGNNYGFSKTTAVGLNVISNAIPSNYVSSKWASIWTPYRNESPFPLELSYNLRGDTTNTESARQGPCPEGWHVPSADEWEAIRDAWCVSAEKQEDCVAGQGFAEALQMPTAGYRSYNYGNFKYDLYTNGFYWSSTLSHLSYTPNYPDENENSKAYYLSFNSRNIIPNNGPNSTLGTSRGFSVRCLKNNEDAVTLYLNPNGGKVENAIIDADAQGKVILPTATRDEYNFDGWYDAVDGGNRRGGSGDEITINEDTDLYAHWSEIIPNPIVTFNNGTDVTEFEVESGGTLTNEQIQQILNLTHTKATFDGWYTNPEFNQAFDFNSPITEDISLYAKWTCKPGYTTLKGNGGPDMNCFQYGTMSYEDNDGNEHIIMDRNLGATMTGYGVNAEMGSYGYYYQWGNNYGFGPLSSVITSNTQVDCTNINPSTYSSSTFVIGSNDFDWCSSKNDNLWGGSEDGSGNNRGLDTISTTAADRQGPCPDGWHVPSIGERETLLIYGASLNSGTRKTGIRFYNYEMSFSNFIKFTNDFKLPIAGQRAHEGAQLINYGGGGSVNLWSSSPDVDYVWARHFNMNIPMFVASANARSLRGYGMPVRCFMNNPKTVTFNYNGGEGENFEINIPSGTKVTAPADPTNGNHIFAGWYEGTDDGQTLSDTAFDFNEEITKNVDLYAKWVSCGDGEIFSPELGKCVARWHELVSLTDDTTTTTVGSDEPVDGLPTTITVIENNILELPEGEALSEAEGKELVGDITIDFGGENAKFSRLVKVKIPVEGSSKAYVKVKHVGSTKYNFDGLTTNTGASCDDGDVVSPDDMYHGEYMNVESGYVSIYTCEASDFAAFGLPKLTFEPNNGSGATVVEVENGATVNSGDIPTVTKEGYNFSGWYLTGAESAFDFSGTTITGDITLYAKWQEDEGVTYTVSFDTNRGTFADTPASQNVLGGEYATDPATFSGYKEPELPGYAFTGWWTEPRDGTQWDFANDVVTGNITLYAHWEYEEIFGDLDVYLISSTGAISTYVMMDRNLGATGVYNKNFDSQNPSSFGFVYQWGNNYGFPRCNGNGTCNYSPITDTQVSVDIVENYIPSKFASSTWIGKNGSNGSKKSWYVSDNTLNHLWGNGNTIDMQGPCPDGYHVPLTSETNDEGGLFRVWGDIYDKTINTIQGKGLGFPFLSDDQELFSSQFLFPHAGNHKKGNTREQEQNMCGDYWTATPSGTENAINMWFCKDGDNSSYDTLGNFLFTNNSQRNNGSTLRCFKNSTGSANLDIISGGKKGLITVHKVDGVTTINAIKEPENTDANGTGLIFGGWYTSPNFEPTTMKTGGDTLSDSVTALYAKWDCPDGLVYNSDNECISGVLVRFMDGETEYTRSVVLSGEEVSAPAINPIKAGHIFTGWFESGANLPFVFTGTPITGNLDLYAHWEDLPETEALITVNYYLKNLDVENNKLTGGVIKYSTGVEFIGEIGDTINISGTYLTGVVGYYFDHATVFSGEDEILADEIYLEGNKEVNMYYIPEQNQFTLNTVPYSSTEGSSTGGMYYYGAKVILSGASSDDHYLWSGWIGLPEGTPNSAQTEFYMPNRAVTVTSSVREKIYDVYTVTFKNRNGDFLWSGKVVSGEMPTYSGSTPSRSSTEQVVYNFNGWYPELSPVTGNITYTATYTEAPRLYTITLTGTPAGYGTLSTGSLSKEYGAAIVISGDKLTVGGTEVILSGNEGYDFQEWTGTCGYVEGPICNENIIYTHPGVIEFTGSNNLIIRNPGYDLFSEANFHKDFEISFNILNLDLKNSVNQATLISVKNEDLTNVWPGFTVRRGSATNYQITANGGIQSAVTVNRPASGVNSLKIKRKNNILYISENDGEDIQIYNYTGFSDSYYFDNPIAIGSIYKEQTGQRYIKATLSNILIKTIDTCYTGNVYVVTGDCQMTAKYTNWTPSKYAVTGSVAVGQENMGYLSGATSTGTSLTGLYEYGAELIFIAVPELGYLFDYWEVNGSQELPEGATTGENQLNIIVNQILDIIAHFKPSNHTPYTVEHYKQNVGQTGYDFEWSGTMYGTTNDLTNATGTDYEGFDLRGNLVDYQTGINADGSTVVRLYYDRNVYTITWNNWNGSGITTTPAVYGAHPEFARDGWPQRYRADDEVQYLFIFTGWSRSGSSEIIRELTGLTTEIVTGDTTYIAQYDQTYRSFEVRYHPNEGTGNMENQTFQLYTSGALSLNNFIRTGYEFDGWLYYYADDATGFYENGQTINVEKDYVKGDRERELGLLYFDLYAQWKPSTDVKVTVNYYLKDLDADNNVLINSGTEYATGVEFTGTADSVVESILATYGTGIEGYEYSKSIVYGSDYPGGVETGTTTILANGSRVIDMYYVPRIYQFTLNFESHSTTAGSSVTSGYYYGANVRLSGDSNDDCFTWSGWTASGITLSDNTVKQTLFTMPANNVEATPTTTENTYNIIFNGNGNTSGTMSPMNGVKCTESTGLTISTFGKTGYTFTGWSTIAGGTREYVDGATVDRLSTGADVNLYAVWDINKYDVSANVATGDHGSLQWSGAGIYEFGETLVIIAVPELGYLFDYWEVNGSTELPEGATTGENQLTIVVNQILDIVAHFTENEKTVTVNYYEMDTEGLYSNEPYYMDSLTGLVGQTKSINPESRIGFHLDDNRSNTWVTISENSEDNVINIYYERERYIIERSGRYYQMPYGTYIDFVNIIPDNQPYYQYYYGEEIRIESIHPAYGWIFSGWYDATSEGKGFPSDEVNLDSRDLTFHMPNHDVWVEPIMYHIPYTLSFTGYEGAEITNLESCIYGTGDRETYYDYSECLPYLNKEGYWFNGWDDENGNWVRRLNDYSQYPILNKMPAHDYMLVANFEPINTMPYEKYYYFQDIEGTGYTLSGDLTDLGNNGVTDQEMPGREPLYNIDGFQYSGFGYSGVMLPRDQWPIIKPIGDNYINYYYDRKVYLVDVNYDNKIMSITGAGEYRYEAPVNLVATVNTGYQFSGFSSYQGELLSSGSVYNFTMPDSFVDIYADANPIEYSIEYEPNGGELDPYSSYVNYTVESSDLSIGNPYKDGYKFLGWTGGVVSGGIEGEEDIVEPTRDLIIAGGSIGDRKYYANWEPDEVKVTVNYYLKKIDSENNTLIDGVDIYLAGVEYTGLSDDIVNIFSRYGTGIEGYHYDHAAVFSGGERTGATETTVLPDGSREINMYYIPNKYNFTLNSDLYSSTEGSSEITGYYYGAAVRLSGGSNNDCFTWSGWATSGIILSDNTVKQTLFTMPANDVEVTPSTTEKTYNIIFNGNGSTLGEMSPMNGVRCTESIGLTLNSFGKNGYTFTGWSTTSGDNIREYIDGQAVSSLSMNDGENVNLYAVWNIDWYTVTFDLNGGSLTGDMTLTTGYTIETSSISLERYIPVKSGYMLIGWYRDDTLVDHIAGGETGDYILIAHWKADSDTLYTVKYYKENLNGGYDVWTGIYTGETDIEVTALVKDFTGFTYSGGNENNVTTGVVIGDGSLLLKLYYDRNEYEVTTGEVEHGTMEGGTGSQKYGKRITFTAHPDAGYVISKWLRNENEILSGGVVWTGEELQIEVDTGMEMRVEFEAKSDTPYYVEYYKEKLEGGYEVWTGTYSGTTDQEAVAQELSFTGFTYDSGDERNERTGNIDGDGSRVLRLYYNREIYTITWLNEDGTDMDTTTVKYGEIPTHADPTQPADAHYTYKFKGWDPEPTFATGEILYRATYEYIANKYTITWKNDDGSLIDKTMVEYGTIPTHTKPTKAETEDYRYVFAGWDPEVVAVVGDAEYTAVFNAEKKEKSSKGGGMSGGGGRGGNIDNSDNQHGSAEENIDGSGYTGDEVVEVDDTNKDIVPLYKWTYENNVTTMDTLEDADPDGLLTRGHLAKMVVNYMVNVLGRSMPYDITYNCLYWGDDESSWESDEIRDYATKACAFGVMGINMEDNKFLPNSIVTRAEFGTVMSRVLWGDKYDITDTNHRSYFEDHLQALKKDNILTQIANPETRWEIRKWVWLVFRRIVEKYKK